MPFDRRRDGFVIGEGGGGDGARGRRAGGRARGATVLGRLTGYGATADAYHLTAPDPEGDGAARAMQAALRDAEIEPGEVDYVNAHGTSTAAQRPLRDRGDQARVRRARRVDPGLVAEVVDRPPARRRGRRRGGRHGAARSRARSRRRRSTWPSPTRASTSTTSRARGARARAQRAAAGGDLELVRVRRPQRRPVLGGDRVSAGATVRTGAAPATGQTPRPAARLEALCDPGSFRALRTAVRSTRAGDRAIPGDGVLGGRRHRRRPAHLLLRRGPRVHGRLAWRGARADDRPRDGPRRTGRRAGGRLRRVRRRPPAGGPRRAGGLRPHLPRDGRRSRAGSRRSRSSAGSRPAAAPTPRRSPTSSS